MLLNLPAFHLNLLNILVPVAGSGENYNRRSYDVSFTFCSPTLTEPRREFGHGLNN